jgi:murein tripeptide amidase MpaA
MRKIYCFIIALIVSFNSLSQVADSYYLPQDISYDPKIPTPKQFLGYQVGEQHVTPYEQYAYWRKLAELSPRFRIETYGKSFENRELLLVTVTSPQNHSKINEIKSEQGL